MSDECGYGWPPVDFESVREMKQDILTGNYTQEERENIQGFPRESNDGYWGQMFDLDALVDVEYPLSLDLRVVWSGGKQYDMFMENRDKSIQCVWYYKMTEEWWNEELSYYMDFSKGMHTIEEDRNAKVFRYEGND